MSRVLNMGGRLAQMENVVRITCGGGMGGNRFLAKAWRMFLVIGRVAKRIDVLLRLFLLCLYCFK